MSIPTNPVIFSDRHHQGLYESLSLLFEKRLGGTLYSPVGLDWYIKGYWKVYDSPETADQYLGANAQRELGDKGITLDKFWELPIDVVIATIPEHIEPFKRLTELHSHHPKLIFQVGNAFSVQSPSIKNVMASAKVDQIPSGVHLIEYHQEFPLDIFRFMFPNNSKNIYSFINCFNTADIFKEDWKLFLELEKLMPDWNFRSLGGQCRDGLVSGDQEMANKMSEARIGFHLKHGGDGYGHVIFNWAAIGRPVIVKMDYYRGKLAEKLMLDGKTCIAVDGLSPQEIVNKINYYATPDLLSWLGGNSFENFKDQVDFDAEEIKIKVFLEHLL